MKIAGGKKASHIPETHEANLEEYGDEESAPYKAYYMLLY